MNDEQSSNYNAVGLYHDPASGQYIGAIDPIQADAMVQQGWKLHTAVTEKPDTTIQKQVEALASDDNIASLRNDTASDDSTDSNDSNDKSDKKGKK